jgi:rhodanese-related sulfurtransferase
MRVREGRPSFSREDEMPHEVHERAEVQGLIERGAQVVEVLGPEEFEEDHLPGAINLPLRRVEREARGRLDPSRPVVVYCWDSA